MPPAPGPSPVPARLQLASFSCVVRMFSVNRHQPVDFTLSRQPHSTRVAAADAHRAALPHPCPTQVDDAIERCGNYGRFQWCILGVAGFDWMASALQVGSEGRAAQMVPQQWVCRLEQSHLAPAYLRICLPLLQVMLLAFLGPSVECAWGLSPAQLGVLTSVVFAGMTVGGPLWGCIADGWGRRTSLIIAVAWLAAFGFASAAAQSFAQLLALRFFVGMGLISKSVSFNLLMEFSPVATRGFFLITVEGFWVVGTVVQAGLAHWLLDTYGW